MSGISSGLAIPVYLSAIANEATQVARNLQSDPQLAARVTAFEKTAPTLGSAAAILNNYGALQMLTGAYNMSGQINQTAILRTLMTQDPDSSGSLVSTSANTNYLHFARATQVRNSQTANLGPPGALVLPTGGGAAASLTMQNQSWNTAGASAGSPGVRWTFVLNDGSAQASLAASLDAAAKAGGVTATYSVAADGTVSGNPAVTVTRNPNGNVTYSLPIATDSSGNLTQEATVVSVAVTAGTSTAVGAAQLAALQGAMEGFGFDASVSGGSLTVNDPPTAGVNTLARDYGNAIAIAGKNTLVSPTTLALGQAGLTLSAGQVLVDGSNPIGTVASVDSTGLVTLTAAASTQINPGDTIQVATGLGFTNVGQSVTTGTATAAGATTLSLGSAGASLSPGQNVTANGVTIGTIGAVASNGTVTLLAGSTEAVAAGTTLTVLPTVTAGTTAALSDADNVAAIVKNAEYAGYESDMDQRYPGMGDALYFTRTMPAVSSITQLMSDSRLLSVVTTSLGMDSYFGALDYDQQVRILTQKVNLTTLNTPSGIQRTAEQFLIAKQQETPAAADTGILSLFGQGGGNSTQSLLLQIAGLSPAQASSSSDSNPALALFA